VFDKKVGRTPGSAADPLVGSAGTRASRADQGLRPTLSSLAAILLVVPPSFAAAPLPDDVAVQAFAKPANSNLQLLVRVPMAIFGDIRFPQRGAENYLDIPQVDAMLPGVAKYWLAPSLKVYENNILLPQPMVTETRLALESDQSFLSYDQALAHLHGPRVDTAANIFWRQAWLDILFEYPTRPEPTNLSIRFDLAHLGARVHTDLKYLAPDGTIRAFNYSGDPGLIRLNPTWYEAAFQFLQWGVFHFLTGSDYLLFVFCLVFPLRGLDASVPVAAAFASASTVALLASAWGLAPAGLWFQPLIETAIAASILSLALANIAGWITPQRRASITLIFGLLFGFSFAFDLSSKMQFGGAHPLI